MLEDSYATFAIASSFILASSPGVSTRRTSSNNSYLELAVVSRIS